MLTPASQRGSRPLCYNSNPMGEPLIVPRAEHVLSRKHVDPDALKVLYRLEPGQLHGVPGRRQRARPAARPPAEGLRHRDVGAPLPGQEALPELLDHRPALPARARALRRRRPIEVATFRRQVSAEEARRRRHPAPDAGAAGQRRGGAGTGRRARPAGPSRQHLRHAGGGCVSPRLHDQRALLRHRDVLDHRLHRRPRRSARRVVRCIGEPDERFQEDPVRMLRAVAMAARLDFTIDPPIDAAIAAHRGEIARSAPARLIEEFYKLLRSGSAGAAFRMMAERTAARTDRRRAADARRRPRCGDRWPRSTPIASDSSRRPTRSPTPILLGSLLMPLGHGCARLCARRGGPTDHAEGAAAVARHAAAGAARRRTAAADPRAAAAADGHEAVAARAAGADAPGHRSARR